MASNKNRILEPYGYRGQDEFNSNAGKHESELNAIKKVNNEQTDEINRLLSGKAGTDIVSELSAYTLSAITRLDNEDALLWEAINEEISARTNSDEEIWDTLSALTSACTESQEDILDLLEQERQARIATDNDLYGLFSGVSGNALSSLSGLIETEINERQSNDDLLTDRITSAETALLSAITAIEEGLAEEILARISGDTYLQEEIDALSGNVADNTSLIQELDDALNNEISGLNASVSSLSGTVDTLSGAVQTVEHVANNALNTVTGLSSTIAGIVIKQGEDEDKIHANTDAIEDLKNDLGNIDLDILVNVGSAVSANTQSIEKLKQDVSGISETLDDKLDIDDFEIFSGDVVNNITIISGAVSNVSANTINIENINNTITNIDSSITNINTSILQLSQSAQTLNDGLAQEIADRIDGDNTLLGNIDDSADDVTIYGTRQLVQTVGADTLASAKTYVDNSVTYVLGEAGRMDDELEEKITTKLEDYATWSGISDVYASKVYVNEQDTNTLNAAKAHAVELRNEVVSGYQQADSALEKRVNHNAVQIQHITEFDFVENPGVEYDNSGNGVLDVLHREFHRFTGSTIIGSGGTAVIGSTVWESGTTEGVRSQVVDQTSATKQPMIQIHEDGTLWLWIENQWACLHDILKGLVGETY